MSSVLDASVTLAWFFEDERTPPVNSILNRVANEGAFVPQLWRLEVINGMQMAVRRRRFDPEKRSAAVQSLLLLPIAVDYDSSEIMLAATIELSDRFNLTIYDAAYLELAYRKILPVATLDKALSEAAQKLGVATLDTGRASN